MVIDACRLKEIQGKRYDSMSLQSGGAKACGAVFDWDITVLSRPVKYSSIEIRFRTISFSGTTPCGGDYPPMYVSISFIGFEPDER